jgi:hypothetical protein
MGWLQGGVLMNVFIVPVQWCGIPFIAHRGRGHHLSPYNLATKVNKVR